MTTGPIAGEQSVEVLAAVAVLGGGLSDGELIGDDLEDSDQGFRRGTGLSPMS